MCFLWSQLCLLLFKLLAWSDGTSCWHCHTEHGHCLSAGADVNRPGLCSSTALHLAANVNSPKLVLLLLSSGAVATASLDDGTTALHCACQTSDGCGVAAILLEHAASLSCRTRRNNRHRNNRHHSFA